MKKQEFLYLLIILRMVIILIDKNNKLYTFIYKESWF